MMGGTLYVPGFKASAASAGIKGKGKKDLALFVSDLPATSAVVFTRNRVQAAPILWARENCRLSRVRAILVNAGNANACTGLEGQRAVGEVVDLLSSFTGIKREEILPCSTGVIGVPFPVGKVLKVMGSLVEGLSPVGFRDAAEAIMTTDSFPKAVRKTFVSGGKRYVLLGLAKGAGMIAPNMGTMLSYVFTDVKVSALDLRSILKKCVDGTFNRIIVDGDTSTNDTVAIMANGFASDAYLDDDGLEVFQETLFSLMEKLALKIVSDGEGATRVVKVTVCGADSDRAAEKIARTIGTSLLVKTAIFGADFNWGRVVAAAGRAGVDVDPEELVVYYDGVRVFGPGLVPDTEGAKRGRRVVRNRFYEITVKVGMGSGEYYVFTSDLTHDYVTLNSEYTT